jgi:hypothetical protein
LLYFRALNQTAATYEEARDLWARSKECVHVPGSPFGAVWRVNLLKEERDAAPPDMRDRYAGAIRDAETLSNFLAAPTTFRSPLG